MPAASPAQRRGAIRRVAAAGMPIDPGEADETVMLTMERAEEVKKVIQRHAAGTPGLFFHSQDQPGHGVQLRVAAADGSTNHVTPVIVMDDSGASCNLMAKPYAEHIQAKKVRVHSALNGSVGGPRPITEAIWADVVVAAGTPYQAVAPRQLFYLVPSDRLFDVLIGNEGTRLGPLESHVDGQDQRYHYTTQLGSRHSIPMVTARKTTSQGGEPAAVTLSAPDTELFAFTAWAGPRHIPSADGAEAVPSLGS